MTGAGGHPQAPHRAVDPSAAFTVVAPVRAALHTRQACPSPCSTA